MDLSFLRYASREKIGHRIDALEKEIQQKEKEVLALCQGSNWSRIAVRYPGVGKFGSVTFCVYALFCSTLNKAYSPKQLQEELQRYRCIFHLRSIQKAIATLRKAGVAERVCAGMYAYKEPPEDVIYSVMGIISPSSVK